MIRVSWPEFLIININQISDLKRTEPAILIVIIIEEVKLNIVVAIITALTWPIIVVTDTMINEVCVAYIKVIVPVSIIVKVNCVAVTLFWPIAH